MINQNEIFQNWMAGQKKNPAKVIGCLVSEEKGSKFCCLGVCSVENGYGVGDSFTKGVVIRADYDSILPYPLAVQLNIDGWGSFTEKGKEFVLSFIEGNKILIIPPYNSNNINSLADINDRTSADHVLIGKLIEHLACVEREKGIECFKPYPA